jgi:RND family efflux transporter MFP subunit
MTENQSESSRADKPANKVQEKAPSKLRHFLVAMGFLAVGVLITFILVSSRKPPRRVEQKTLAPLVEVQRLNAHDIQMFVRGFGTVTPKVLVEVAPQVSGKVVYVNPEFKAGGFIRAGEKLFQIDPRDYELAVRQAQALVADAQVNLDLEKAEAQLAPKQWEELYPNTEPTSPLVLREPQIRQAEARLESANAQLATAQLSLQRTQLSLPIDAVIMSEKVDLGQFVVTGQSIGVAYGTKSVEIELPLQDEELAWFDMPGNPVSANKKQSSAKRTSAQVKADFAGPEHSWTGYVRRTTGQIDTTSRLVSVVIEVPEPFKNSDSKPPLFPGMFVEVLIEGKVLKNAVAVPRDAVRNGTEVWVVEDGRLYIRPLNIVRTDKDFAYTVSGLDDGAQIVVSALDIVTEGMKVRTKAEAAPDSALAASPDSGN